MGGQEAVDPVRHQFLRQTRIAVVRTVEIKALRLRFCQACICSYTVGRVNCLCPLSTRSSRWTHMRRSARSTLVNSDGDAVICWEVLVQLGARDPVHGAAQ